MKKVLIIMPELYYGGAEKQFRYLIDGLSKYTNIELTVCIEQSYGAKLKNEGVEFENKHENVDFLHMKGLNAKQGKIYKLKSAVVLFFKLYKKLKKISPDVILGYGPLYSAILPLLKKKQRMVILGERCDGKYSDVLTRHTTKCADLIIANSRAATEYMQEHGYKNVKCITNGIELANVKNVTQAEKRDTFIIFMPARVSEVKNQKQVIEALKLIHDFKCEVIFAGEIQDESYYEVCKALIEEDENIKFIGAVANIEDYYNMCDIVVLPSRFEGTPNVILEGFAYRRVCIASDIIMNKDVIRNSKLMFPLDNPQKMAEVIECVYNMSKEIRNKIINDNYDYLLQNYSVDKMVEKYVEVINS